MMGVTVGERQMGLELAIVCECGESIAVLALLHSHGAEEGFDSSSPSKEYGVKCTTTQVFSERR
jgi:hypothetical protein